MSFHAAVILLFIQSTLLAGTAPEPASFAVVGDWDVRVTAPGQKSQTLHVDPPSLVTVNAERYDSLPVFNPQTVGWLKGVQVKGVKAHETTSPNLIDPSSLSLRAGPDPDAAQFTKGVDYDVDLVWGTLGRLEGGAIQPGQAVFAAYRHTLMRLDAVILTDKGEIVLRRGEARAAAPVPPSPAPAERQLGNIYLPGRLSRLTPEQLFPVLEDAYPMQPTPPNRAIEHLAARLDRGESLRILAWGDSVTDGSYLPDPMQRWQEQFVSLLRARYPKAPIELRTQAWGGRNTASYLREPAGSPHNYHESVLGVKPDLVISEFGFRAERERRFRREGERFPRSPESFSR